MIGSARLPKASSAISSPVRLSDAVFAYLLNLPAAVIVFGLIAFPVGYSFWISLHRYDLRRPDSVPFVGPGNYGRVLSSPEFWDALLVTLLFVFLSVSLILVFGLLLALLVNEKFPGNPLVRALILLPWAIPPVVNGMLWQWIYNGRAGALNGLLFSLGVIDSYRSWLLDTELSIVMIVLAHVWSNTPLAALVLLAGLQAIPSELYDAGKVDRAGVFQRFRHITLPWLLHPILIVVILETMVAFKAFDIVYVLTGGGPGHATTVLAWLTYQTAFKFSDLGRGNAYAFLLALLTMGLAVVYLRALYSRGDIRQ